MARLTVEGLRFLELGPFDFELGAGRLVGLSGPSGAGKSRLLRCLVDLDPHEGRITLDDQAQADVPAPVWRRRVGLLPAEARFWLATGQEHLDGADEALLDTLGLGSALLQQPVKRLSSGERQRLGLARLLQAQPQALLLDEPTANLDPAMARAVESLVVDYAQRYAAPVLWVGHDAGQMQRICHRRMRLDKGRLEPQ